MHFTLWSLIPCSWTSTRKPFGTKRRFYLPLSQLVSTHLCAALCTSNSVSYHRKQLCFLFPLYFMPFSTGCCRGQIIKLSLLPFSEWQSSLPEETCPNKEVLIIIIRTSKHVQRCGWKATLSGRVNGICYKIIMKTLLISHATRKQCWLNVLSVLNTKATEPRLLFMKQQKHNGVKAEGLSCHHGTELFDRWFCRQKPEIWVQIAPSRSKNQAKSSERASEAKMAQILQEYMSRMLCGGLTWGGGSSGPARSGWHL